MQKRDDKQFQMEMDSLIKEAEEMRLSRMEQHRKRHMLLMSLGIILVLCGASAFAWFFLVQSNLFLAVASMFVAVILPSFLYFWANEPIKTYQKEFKHVYMPKIAKALGDLKFHPNRGISENILRKTGILPAFGAYKAEDCFMGTYKGAKIMMSEAHLFHPKKKGERVFRGVLVLLEISDSLIEGHTILTANKEYAKHWPQTRWKKLKPVDIKVTEPSWDRFHVFSTKPESASLLVGEKLIKELAEAADIFDSSPMSAVLFKGKYVFMAIPYDHDMFEPSNIFVPVTTPRHAMNCKKEIEQLLEVVDVFDLYQDPTAKGAGKSTIDIGAGADEAREANS